MTDSRTLDTANPTKMAHEVDRFIEERDAAIRTLDMDYARRMMPAASNDEVRLTAMHKARYEITKMDATLRQESRAWLLARGYGRISGEAWSADGSLPE